MVGNHSFLMKGKITDQIIALVTGANKGIGFEAVRQLAKNSIIVILTSRDEAKGKKAQQQLAREGFDVDYHQLDVTDKMSIDALFSYIEKKYARLDIVVNNAGILLDAKINPLDVPLEIVKKTMETNSYGPLLVCQKFIPLMRKNNYGRIINISSGMGQFSDLNGGYLAYRVSKTALNAITRILANETQGQNILINTMCPGWVKTDMGGKQAPRLPIEPAQTILWLATLPNTGPTGKFFRDKKEIAW